MAPGNIYNPNHAPAPSTTESRILETFLLHPSALPTILPFQQFILLFPKAQQSHPRIRTLYRDLQLQRNLDLETVRSNIEREVSRGAGQRLHLLRQLNQELRDSEGGGLHDPFETASIIGPSQSSKVHSNINQDPTTHVPEPEGNATEAALDHAMFAIDGQLSNLPSHSNTTFHTLPSLLAAMRSAATDLEKEAEEYETKADETMDEMGEIVGQLSDLRYGKFARVGGENAGDGGGIESQIEQELRRLAEVCERKMGIQG